MKTFYVKWDQASYLLATLATRGLILHESGTEKEEAHKIIKNISKFNNFRVASVSDKLLMANRDIRQICDQQWTVTVVDQVLGPFLMK